jgi:hypothetical protein
VSPSSNPSRSGWARAWVAIAIATIATAGLSSCGQTHRDRVRATSPTTISTKQAAAHITDPAVALFVGDSLLFDSKDDVEAAARAARWIPVVDGRPGSGIDGGFTIGSWPPRIDALARVAKPDVAVVELGTNGCYNCPSLDAAIDADLAPLRNVPVVYWVNVKDYSRIPADPKTINDAITAATKRWPNLRVIDLNDQFRGHGAWLSSDDIHFTAAGEAAFAQLLVHSLPPVG